MANIYINDPLKLRYDQVKGMVQGMWQTGVLTHSDFIKILLWGFSNLGIHETSMLISRLERSDAS